MHAQQSKGDETQPAGGSGTGSGGETFAWPDTYTDGYLESILFGKRGRSFEQVRAPRASHPTPPLSGDTRTANTLDSTRG